MVPGGICLVLLLDKTFCDCIVDFAVESFFLKICYYCMCTYVRLYRVCLLSGQACTIKLLHPLNCLAGPKDILSSVLNPF